MGLVREDMEMVGARERETKLTEGEDFRGEATSNREKPKEEKDRVDKQYWSFPKIQLVIKASAKNWAVFAWAASRVLCSRDFYLKK